MANNGKNGPHAHPPELVYHAELSLEGMTMDFSRHSTSVPFAKSKAKATMYNVVKAGPTYKYEPYIAYI